MKSNYTVHSTSFQSYPNCNFFIGLSLAILSTIFIGSSFIIKKKALIKLSIRGSLRAGAGGFGYLKEWMWWAGFLTMGIGEIANFAAYTFAPATLVTPLGGLSVLVSAVLASKFLHEKLNILGKLGCLLCILGSIIIVLHSPKNAEVKTMEALLHNLMKRSFLVYAFLVLVTFCCVFFYLGPLYGRQNVVIYILLCSAVGSLTVMACKGLGLAVKSVIAGDLTASTCRLAILFLLAVAVFVVVQMNYLNKALDLFDTGIVTPIYYVLFTVLVIVASTILFSEWSELVETDIAGILCGFLIVIVALILLNGFKDLDVNVQNRMRNVSTDTFLRIHNKKLSSSEEQGLESEVEPQTIPGMIA